MGDNGIVRHARNELALAGETDRRFVASLLRAVREFVAYRHSGGSAALAVRLLERLLRQEALTPLTSDPAEWVDQAERSGLPMWQSKRDPRAFSTDGGQTWWFVDPRNPGERCTDSGEPGTAVACGHCGGSGVQFQADAVPALREAGRVLVLDQVPPRPFTR
jgi:hypothetical protein